MGVSSPSRKPPGKARRSRGRPGKSAPCYLVVRDMDQLKALADPLRLRILQGFVQEPRTAKQVAQQMGEKPGRLYHHVAVLESVGLLRPTHTRQVRGTIEKYYRAVASQFEVDGALLSPVSGSGAEDTKRVEMVHSLLAQARFEVLESYRRRRASGDEGRPFIARMVMRTRPDRMAGMLARLRSFVAQCSTGPTCKGARVGDAAAFAVTIVCAPVVDGDGEIPVGAGARASGRASRHSARRANRPRSRSRGGGDLH